MYKIVFLLINTLYVVAASRILGGDRDEYGCIHSAGYTWCNETKSCVSANHICRSQDF